MERETESLTHILKWAKKNTLHFTFNYKIFTFEAKKRTDILYIYIGIIINMWKV